MQKRKDGDVPVALLVEVEVDQLHVLRDLHLHRRLRLGLQAQKKLCPVSMTSSACSKGSNPGDWCTHCSDVSALLHVPQEAKPRKSWPLSLHDQRHDVCTILPQFPSFS
jgi:hypothetical protein